MVAQRYADGVSRESKAPPSKYVASCFPSPCPAWRPLHPRRVVGQPELRAPPRRRAAGAWSRHRPAV